MVATVNSTGTSTGVVITPDSSGVLALQTGGTTAITVDASQNVGIGTSSPAQKLHVNGNIQIAASSNLYFTNASGYSPRLSNSGSNDSLSVFTNNTEAMRITTDPYVYIGCTANPSSTVSGVRLSNPTTAQCVFGTAPNTGAYTAIAFVNGNGQVGRIDTSGSSTAYVTSSDYRLKENVAPMTGALAKVSQLKPVTYKWKVDGKDGEGFIAHELSEICPDAVLGEKDAVDEEGNPKYQGIDVSFLVATLTAALQELKAINDTQAETINALTARIVALEGA